MFFNRSSWYDEATSVTQCGITTNATYTYIVDPSTPGKTGAFWYHGHTRGQYVDGFRAPLVIHRSGEKARKGPEYHDEYVVAVFDWYHEEHRMLLGQLLDEANPLDGTNVEPYPIDMVTLLVGSADLGIGQEPDGHQFVGAYELGAHWGPGERGNGERIPDNFDFVPDDVHLNITTAIFYNSSFPTADSTTVDEDLEFPDAGLVPVDAEAEARADVSITLAATFDTADDGTNRAFLNEEAYVIPVTPTLLTASLMGNLGGDARVYGRTSICTGIGAECRDFQMVGTTMDVTSDDVTVNPPVHEGIANHMWGDIIMMPPGGSRIIWLRADNPVAWLFDCHVKWHLEFYPPTSSTRPRQSRRWPKLAQHYQALGVSVAGNSGEDVGDGGFWDVGLGDGVVEYQGTRSGAALAIQAKKCPSGRGRRKMLSKGPEQEKK
ncbi:ferroxidase fet3 [Gonapodya sp. JEL0774]|nr:ferroxidase fet3 [Gonapodya sp. JEL0774]